VYVFLIRITSRVDLAMSVCPYECCDLGNYKSRYTETKHVDSRDSLRIASLFRQCAAPTTTTTVKSSEAVSWEAYKEKDYCVESFGIGTSPN